jgi:hypothetical protein
LKVSRKKREKNGEATDYAKRPNEGERIYRPLAQNGSETLADDNHEQNYRPTGNIGNVLRG